MPKRSAILAVLMLAASCPAIAAPPPISAFARQENMRSVAISPDGKQLVYLTSIGGRRIAATLNLAARSAARPVLTPDKDDHFDITWCRWANDTRVVCAFQAAISEMGVTYRMTRLVAANADGTEQKVLMQNGRVGENQDQDNILDWTSDDPNTVLIQAYESEGRTPGASIAQVNPRKPFPSVFKLNVYDGRVEQVVKPFSPILSFRSDGKGNVRLGAGLVGTQRKFFARLDGDRDWRELAKIEVYERTNEFVPIAIIPGKNSAYATGSANGRIALYEIDLEDKRPPQLLFNHPLVDVGSALRDDDGELVGVFYETDRPFIYYTDEKLGALMDSIKAALPGAFNTIQSVSRDRSKLVIRSQSDVDNGTYYLYDAAAKGLMKIGTSYPELDPAQLAGMRTIEYPARDGTLIPGYLTVPVGVRAEKLPLIVMPHGGPIARDSWRFDFLRQFLASRGYAVLSMNFRGSSGYGGKWFRDAFQDWGGLTYSDITDGARWAVEKGVADPQRVCVVGWSFGGYAALLGATRSSDLYQCSISIAGISDLSDLSRNAARFRNGRVAQKQIGSDSDKLKNDSPSRHAKDVRIPVLLVHGDLDAQSPVAQSREMADALKNAGKTHKLVVIEKGDHSLWRESERTTLLTEVEQFLREHLGAGVFPSS
jgi:dipeptidyl aminopeptidase/acylaminoacyl peptidase